MALEPTPDLSHVIQLAVAPVFLLAGIGGLFIAAMFSLIGGLIAFLRGGFVAVRSLSTGLTRRDA